MANIHIKIEAWKKLLLDLGKRNRLLNFKETKRSNVTITYPELKELYDAIVYEEKTLSFPHAEVIDIDEDAEEVFEDVYEGDLKTNKTFPELQRTLKVLRAKSKSTIEEQGINTLYLAFGFLRWTESKNSDYVLSSPIILVPVTLTIESISSPYLLHVHEDEIVLNPTLVYKLENDFGMQLPEFDSNETNIEEYLDKVARLVKSEKWEVEKVVNLTALSFLKINMYKDLERNQDRIADNPVSSAIAGNGSILSYPKELENYDHDTNTRPVHTFQVMDADSSQQDAILLSKKGVSFVLQGPPGTGKSQTITNIISEALADGKKVLFVAEKMAALQVVHKRLANAGLSDFCLTLHSHKANKKEILQDLSDTLNLDKTRTREEAIEQLNILEATRKKLNQYHQELHAICAPLNRSIYDVNGKLAALQSAPDLVFDIVNPGQTSQDQLSDIVYLLRQYAATIGKMSEDFRYNPWYNSTVPLVTHELRHDIDTKFPQLLSCIRELTEESKAVLSHFSIPFDITMAHVDVLVDILNFVGGSPSFPVHWLAKDLSLFAGQTKEFQTRWEEIQKSREELLTGYKEDILQIDAMEEEKQLQTIIQEIGKLLNHGYPVQNEDVTGDIKEIHKNVCELLATAIRIDECRKEINDLLDIQEVASVAGILPFKQLLGRLSTKPVPTAIWFDLSCQNAITGYCSEAAAKHLQLNRKITELELSYDKDILEINYNSMLKRFRTDYGSFWKLFKSQYRKDKKLLLGYARHTEKLTDNAIIELLQTLKAIAEKKEWIRINEQKLKEYFGSYYTGLHTKWDEIPAALEQFLAITAHFNHLIPAKLKNHLLQNTLPIEKIIRAYEICKGIDEQKFTYTLIGLSSDCGFEEKGLPDVIHWLEQVKANTGELLSLFDKWKVLSIKEWDYESFRKDLCRLGSIQKYMHNLEAGKEEMVAQYGLLYKGAETDWTIILDRIDFAAQLVRLARDYNLPADFVEKTAHHTGHIKEAKEKADLLLRLRDESRELYNWAISLFTPDEQFDQQTLFKLQDRWENCVNKKSSLEEWIDYRNNREACKKAGLENYIRKVEEVKPDANRITDAYLKRFYKLWLDAIVPDFPAVNQFRRNSHEEIIREFKKLDNTQQKIAQSRVRESLVNKLPDFSTITSSRDEVGLLKRELNKQRKLLPLRKLFNEIPNLLMTLKPCCMMSPLSVSVFLEARSYEFDLVIFDEASQVCTENAIGAIMRGKQVVIVGDSKQLPPTNFFAATLSDNDFDTDNEEDDDTGAYESILDESLNVLPERSLKWHYRSRHENLIAFSNAKIYGNTLITFPSNKNKLPDIGVEYIHVPDGVYDRGGKKHNLKEANKVADLVFDHFSRFPDRSLGIVTFSEAQQHAIESIIDRRKLSDHRFDPFFSEEKEEPFFIKNLENVQGDERDTIIFSIGYAKDAHGIMYMNFGPLSRNGGERRLNVAITRAKHNVKLVGSILPDDISLEKTNSEGVKLLRNYIRFAREGENVLAGELKYTETIELDSPFEESVHDFLVTKGYKVTTQVGCSGFRIDMAVKHPEKEGIFVLGIECDGATYHSSRTARERDRLRQEVLENMGWKIYRIWSTDWIKDTITEGEKLINAIEQAIATYSEESVSPAGFTPVGYEEPITEEPAKIEEVIPQKELEQSTANKYGFQYYEEADVDQIVINYTYEQLRYPTTQAEIVKRVIEIEQPIYSPLLFKRMAKLYGYEKASSNLQGIVSYLLKEVLKDEITKDGSFLWLKTMPTIPVRIPAPGQAPRLIEQISIKEIAKAMLGILPTCFGITPAELKTVTARTLGYSRSGTNVTGAMNQAYEYLLEKKRIKEVEGKVALEGVVPKV